MRLPGMTPQPRSRPRRASFRRKLAQLPAKDGACLRDTLRGYGQSLWRGGQLKAGIRLVADRSLEQRQFCLTGQGYDSKPIFDVRFLVQEWARRGHAAP